MEDWNKLTEVGLAMLFLSRRHRKSCRQVRNQMPSVVLQNLCEDGLIEDEEAPLGWVGFTESGYEEAIKMLEKHFGIVVLQDAAADDASRRR